MNVREKKIAIIQQIKEFLNGKYCYLKYLDTFIRFNQDIGIKLGNSRYGSTIIDGLSILVNIKSGKFCNNNSTEIIQNRIIYSLLDYSDKSDHILGTNLCFNYSITKNENIDQKLIVDGRYSYLQVYNSKEGYTTLKVIPSLVYTYNIRSNIKTFVNCVLEQRKLKI